MPRSSAVDSIVLPRLTANGALALGKQLIAAAEPYKTTPKFPKVVANGLKALHMQWDELANVLQQLLKPEENTEKPDAQKADRILDAGYSALYDFLESRRKLFWRPDAAEATELQRIIYPTGLKFIQLPYPLQWAESDTRLRSIDENKLDARIKTLGGKLYLDEIIAAHAAYGKALAMTEPMQANPEDAPGVRKARDAFAEKLKRYWINVEGSVDETDAKTQELADALLAPLKNWDVAAAAAKPTEPKQDGADPTNGATGG
ncbi:MAG TPA: hypothetical protein PK156_28985 [Polyangium sp.]|nr:hypothetical protein [Polyangium sp.]